MILPIYLLLFGTAILGTGAVIWMGSSGGIGGVQTNAKAGILLSAALVLLWGLIAIESFEILIHSGGNQFTESYEELAWLAAGGALVCFVSMVQASLEEIKNTGGI